MIYTSVCKSEIIPPVVLADNVRHSTLLISLYEKIVDRLVDSGMFYSIETISLETEVEKIINDILDGTDFIFNFERLLEQELDTFYHEYRKAKWSDYHDIENAHCRFSLDEFYNYCGGDTYGFSVSSALNSVVGSIIFEFICGFETPSLGDRVVTEIGFTRVDRGIVMLSRTME